MLYFDIPIVLRSYKLGYLNVFRKTLGVNTFFASLLCVRRFFDCAGIISKWRHFTMKIYGQTDTIIVREMTENDCGRFLELMTEHGTNEDFTVEDIKVVWEFRNKKGDIQCTVTSMDGRTIYGFCGIVHKEQSVSLFAEYSGKGYEEQVQAIIERLK